MQLLEKNTAGQFELTAIAAEHLVRGQEFDVGSYLSLAATSPGLWKWWSDFAQIVRRDCRAMKRGPRLFIATV